MTGADRDLQRFVAAQAPVFDAVLVELAQGRKLTHWMWFVFPQLKALGRSPTAKWYGLADAAEARAYWQHPLLGARLQQCVGLLLAVEHKTAHQVFGSPDDLKLKSCLTLFERVAPDEASFGRAIGRYFEGRRDALTLTLLGS